MKQIVTLGIPLTDEYREKLQSFGHLIEMESPSSQEDFLTKAIV